ncbi:MAG TPA: hypothetical protein PLM71_05400 [Syntrophorhabdaceae bacterium]|nr:hypothetical protein [Syntrophorhabdaceae bacterium]
MPIKKQKKKQVKTHKKIKIDIKYILYIAAMLVLIISSYLFFKKEDGTHRGSLNGHLVKKQVAKEKPEEVSIKPVEMARLELLSLEGRDIVRVMIEKMEPEVEYRFQWSINGKIIEDYNKDSISGFKEGDVVGVTITPFLKEKKGQPRFLSLTIRSTTPKILGISEPKIDNDIMVFKILIDDTTKTELTYSLIECPKNMTIDSKTGEIKWNIKDIPSGRYEGKALIKNKKGAEVLYPFTINLS